MKVTENKFIDSTKYLWIGGILGILQQLLGRLDYILYGSKSRMPVFAFSNLLGGWSFWALLILLLIYRSKSPKIQFRDIFLLFWGLDFTYYLWQFLHELPPYLRGTAHFTAFGVDGVGALLLDAAIDFILFTTTGAASAVWGLFATKFRDKGWKKRYYAMLAPLFLVLIAGFINNCIGIVRYFDWRDQVLLGTALEGISVDLPVDMAVSYAVMLALAVIFFVKSRKIAENT